MAVQNGSREVTGLNYHIENGEVILSWSPYKSKLNGDAFLKGFARHRSINRRIYSVNFTDTMSNPETYYYEWRR
jgi:hypothetical protein